MAQDVAPSRMLKQANGQPLLENKRDLQCYQLKVKNIPAAAQVRDPSVGL